MRPEWPQMMLEKRLLLKMADCAMLKKAATMMKSMIADWTCCDGDVC